jgi:hypothetical protein
MQQTLGQLKGCLAEGYPFVFGFTVYQSFETPQVARTGMVPLPSLGESTVGGHATRPSAIPIRSTASSCKIPRVKAGATRATSTGRTAT